MSIKKKSASRGRKPRARKAGFPARKASPFIKRMSTAVRAHFADAVSLPEFLATAGRLTLPQRKLIVQQALVLIEQNYAHLPLKRSMHSIDPVQRLKLLLQALELSPKALQPSESEFHREVCEVFTSLRDLHTNYLLPAPFDTVTAFLPFMVEDYFQDGSRKYIVSHVTQGFNHPTFFAGVEVVYWNGVPIDRAVWQHAQNFAGSNREARHARGMQRLTVRALRMGPPPDEEWVVVGYKTASGTMAELRVDWNVNAPLPSAVDSEDGAAEVTANLGLDLEQDIIQRMRSALFAPQVVATKKKMVQKAVGMESLGDLETGLPGVFDVRKVTTPSGEFGYLRIRTFAPSWPNGDSATVDDFVQEFIRLISSLPERGLILDVRGNGGGIITIGETILQLLTPRKIEPEPVQFINTPLNLKICQAHGPDSQWTDLSPWVESLQQALQTGAAFSAGYPMTNPEQCNAIGQKYFGPVVLITDALCYSTTDIFAAGFQDHEVGTVLGVDDNTGAGGANVWEHRYFVQYVLPGTVYTSLPNGAGMRVAIRRTLRVGRRAGAPVEDLGVNPDKRHYLTKSDLLNSNVDLINAAGKLLKAAGPERSLKVEVQPTSTQVSTVTVESKGMNRFDFYLAERPIQSIDTANGQAVVTIKKPDSSSQMLEIQGFDGTKKVARYRVEV